MPKFSADPYIRIGGCAAMGRARLVGFHPARFNDRISFRPTGAQADYRRRHRLALATKNDYYSRSSGVFTRVSGT